ncbi:jg1263, partial [Pararge aegeria aegeria]
LPSGDPAPGRSPGPPFDEKLESNIEVAVDETVYNEITTTDEVPTTVSEASVSERTVDACAYALFPSDSDNIVTLSERNSAVNLSVSHSVFDSEELVRGVVYDGKFVVTIPILPVFPTRWCYSRYKTDKGGKY